MPKESLHLFLADTARKSIIKTVPEISAVVEEYPNLFMMGSVSPDSVFNYNKGPAKDFFTEFAWYPHDTETHNLFSFLTRIVSADLPAGPSLSFALGTLCHYTADMIFHPLVFHFCGTDKPGSNSATVRHYRFESHLDRLMRWLIPETRNMYLKDYFSAKELTDTDLAILLECICLPEESAGEIPRKEFVSMYRLHCSHQFYYGKLSFSLLAKFLNLISGNKKKALSALFYPDIPGKASEEQKTTFLNRSICFRNPVSGAKLNKNLKQLTEDFDSLYTGYLEPVESVLKKTGGLKGNWKEELIRTFTELIPGSPESGLPAPFPGTRPELSEMTFFNIRSFDEIF